MVNLGDLETTSPLFSFILYKMALPIFLSFNLINQDAIPNKC